MQCLDNKTEQRIEDRFPVGATEEILNCLNSPLQKCARDDFVNFYCCFHKYISKNTELKSQSSPCAQQIKHYTMKVYGGVDE
jgi:hypothetical protein